MKIKRRSTKAETILKKQFILEGLDCANCLQKLSIRIKQLDGISNASLNFMTKTFEMRLKMPRAYIVF
jgi:Cd2+/Zn2+-exporting ATPase